MNAINESDLHDYFALHRQYESAEDAALMGELDQRLSAYKDQFHKNPEAVLQLLEDKQGAFTGEHEDTYNDLVFDLKAHAESIENIKQTHRYDAEQDMWVPK
jgi:hypothetical protein